MGVSAHCLPIKGFQVLGYLTSYLFYKHLNALFCLDGTLVGVVSHGKGCGTNPGIYSDVRHYVHWIKRTINSYHLQQNITMETKRSKEIKVLIDRLLQCHFIDTRFE